MVVIHRLAEITDHPVLQSPAPSKLIRVRSDENRWDPMSHVNQVSVELDPRHSRHLNVADQARGCRKERGCQEIGRGGERFDGVAQRGHELSHGFAKGLIVFDDRD
jgi:hypothetical protein